MSDSEAACCATAPLSRNGTAMGMLTKAMPRPCALAQQAASESLMVILGLSTSGRCSRSVLVNCQERTRPVWGERMRIPVQRAKSSGVNTGARRAR
jgi:hypothetical protein